MRKLSVLLGALVVSATGAVAADNPDPIAARVSLMQANGAATAVAGGMMKGQIPYSPALAKSAIATWEAVALSFGAFFPEGSTDSSRSEAAPKIWEDRAGFDADLAKFQQAAVAAAKASGKDGPADMETFANLAKPVMGTCKSCHQTYRLDD